MLRILSIFMATLGTMAVLAAAGGALWLVKLDSDRATCLRLTGPDGYAWTPLGGCYDIDPWSGTPVKVEL